MPAKKHLLQSFWTLTANPGLLTNQDIQSIARTREKTPAQILFRFLTQINITPLIGTTSEKHMKEDLSFSISIFLNMR